MRHLRTVLLCLSAVTALTTPTAVVAAPPTATPTAHLLASGLEGGSGSTVGPDGMLYVTERIAGRVSRVDPRTGEVTTFASGLPKAVIFIGGAMDIAFFGRTAYVLVTLVGPDVGGNDIVGIYRVDGPHTFTVVADIGAFAASHPPNTDYVVPSGVQYAMQPYKKGFLVTDGHHNRVLRAELDGAVSEVVPFGNIVPTGLERSGGKVYMAEAGPVPHLPADGKIVSFKPRDRAPTEIASGARLLVDVELGPGHRLYGLSQGLFPEGGEPATPALPNTGSLAVVNRDKTFTTVTDGLNQPTSLEFIHNTAYVVTLTGEIWRIDAVGD
jgi:hypothetical protein